MDLELLPDMVLYRIFSNFNLSEKSRLKSVCKRWHFLLQTLEVGSTLVLHDPEMRASLKWLDFIKSIDSDDVCELNLPFNGPLNDPFKWNQRPAGYLTGLANKQLDRIKKFYAFGIRRAARLLLELGHLPRLEILRIENCAYYLEGPVAETKEFQIDLPDLCLLSIQNCFHILQEGFPRYTIYSYDRFVRAYTVFRIRAPNLIYCALDDFEEDAIVQLAYFEKIRYIRCNYFDTKAARKAVNLETLICQRFELPFQLDALPKLKEIAIFPFGSLFQSGIQESDRKHVEFNFKLAFTNLLKQRTSLARSNLKIVVNGFDESADQSSGESTGESFHLNAKNRYKAFKFMQLGFHIFATTKNAEMIAKNYDKLVRPLPFQTRVTYTQVARAFNGQIPANFFKYFPEIQSVKVSAHPDSLSDLLNFLENCSDLKCLDLFNCQFDQLFYEQLARFQSLRYLSVHELSERQIDFSFVCQLKHLDTFELISDLMPVDMAYEFLKKNKTVFIFRKLKTKISIRIIHRWRPTYLSNLLLIDGHEYVSPRNSPRPTIDFFFSYLKEHEYGKFLI